MESLAEQLTEARPGSDALAGTLTNLGLVCLRHADDSPHGRSELHGRAREAFDAAMLIFSELGDLEGMASVEANLGELALEQGHRPAAVQHYMRAKGHLEQVLPANDPRVTSLDDELARARNSEEVEASKP